MKNEKSVASNIMWKFAERISAQLVSLVVSVILARLLDPSHYGLISIVTIFITLANVFVSDGFGSALIQKKNADNTDFSSVLWINIIFSVILYFALFIAAPYLTSFYGDGYELLTPVMRVLGLRLILAAINSVQQAYVSRQMIFKKFFLATLLGTLVSAVVGITMAYAGFGVWALVAQYLTNTFVDTMILGMSLGWIPSFTIDFRRLKGLLNYGWKLLGASLLTNGFVELRALIIGKVYSGADLAYYDKAKQFPNLIIANVNVSLGSVLFSKMSQQQDDIKNLKETTKKSIRFSSYLMMPLMIGLLVVSKNFVHVILTDKWLPCVEMLQLFCIIYMFAPLHTANLQAIKAVGRSDIYLKLEVIKKVVELCTLVVSMWISVHAIVISLAIVTTFFTYLNAMPNKKLIDYSFKEQMMDMIKPFIMSCIMGAIVYCVGMLHIDGVLMLVMQVSVGCIIYVLESIILKVHEFTTLISMAKSITLRG